MTRITPLPEPGEVRLASVSTRCMRGTLIYFDNNGKTWFAQAADLTRSRLYYVAADHDPKWSSSALGHPVLVVAVNGRALRTVEYSGWHVMDWFRQVPFEAPTLEEVRDLVRPPSW